MSTPSSFRYPFAIEDIKDEKVRLVIRAILQGLKVHEDAFASVASQIKAITGASASVPSTPSPSGAAGSGLSQSQAQAVSNLLMGQSTPLNYQGSVLPIGANTFSFSYTTTSITWSWSSFNIYLPSMQFRVQPYIAVPAGNQASTGLSPSTPYYFYPCYNFRDAALQWAIDNSLLVGTGVALSAQSLIALQAQSADGYYPLSSGAMSVTTPSSGGGGGTGKGGSGCLRFGTLVQSSRGLLRVEDLKRGDFVFGLKDWMPVWEITHGIAKQFVGLDYEHGEGCDVTADHLTPGYNYNSLTKAANLSLDNIGWGRDGGHRFPSKLAAIRRVVAEDGWVGLELPAPHLLWVGRREASSLQHNFISQK